MDAAKNELQKKLSTYGQEHLLRYWPTLTTEERIDLVNEIKSIDFETVDRAFKAISKESNNIKLRDAVLEPIPDELHGGISRCSSLELQEYKAEGLRQISQGNVAVLLLAGGQGTRLGVNYPKGMYDVGLPSRKTLYQLQAERIRKLEDLAFEMTGSNGAIPWYIMTSEHTMEATKAFFADHDYFALKEENLIVFEQFMLPCITFDGKIIMQSETTISKAPDGNGGLFRALLARGILDHMKNRGVKFIHVYCVDNILVKMADPIFIGFCITKNVNCAAKVVEKEMPTEPVGVVCRVDGKFKVVEYSEISRKNAEKRNADGRLTFNAGNICNHFFSLEFLQMLNGYEMKYHVAKKKISFIDEDGKVQQPTKPNGIKLEKFVFDVFPFSDKFAAFEVSRKQEFAPLKNDDTANEDSPTCAKEALYSLHRHFIESAGGKFSDDNDVGSQEEIKNGDANGNINGYHKHDGDHIENYVSRKKHSVGICEISPLVSYAGEGLEDIVRGKVLKFPVTITSAKEQDQLLGSY